MGVMTTCTGKFPIFTPRINFVFQRMIANRMTFFDIGQIDMATDAEFVNRLVELKAVAAGMGTVAGHAAAPEDDAMGVKSNGFFTDIFLVAMATYTQGSSPFCPELKLVGISMGVMADGAITSADGSMDMFLSTEFDLVDVALKTNVIYSAGEKGDFGVIDPFLVAAHAVDVCSWSVQPLAFTVQVAMAGKTGGRIVCIFFQTLNVQAMPFRELFGVTEATLLRNHCCSMEEEGI